MHPRRSMAARVGRYELLRHLATGGMAQIFLAKAVGIADFEKLLVLKRILPRLAGDARLVRMFLDEARVAATLHHANIVQVFEVGQDGDAYFFTMEFIHGADLRRILRLAGGAVPLEHALSIVVDAAAGLHHAHERRGADGFPLGLVHRDVSPSNLLVGFDGSVKLADFGIARATLEKQDTSLAVMGKAPYMSPEQVLGQPLDRRSDIYALGAVLHELVTGARLWQGTDERALMRRIAEEEAAPAAAAAPLQAIIGRALERDRGRRYATAEALSGDLEALARREGLFLSRAELSRWMAGLFQSELEPWWEAQRTGVSLASWATASIGTPISRPDAAAAPATERPSRRLPLVITGAGIAFAVAAVLIWLLPSRQGATQPPRENAGREAPAAVAIDAGATAAIDTAPVDRAVPATPRPRRPRKRRTAPRPAEPHPLDDDSRLEIFPR